MWIFQQCSLDFLCSAHIHTDKCIYRICAYRNESTLICNIYIIYIYIHIGVNIYIYIYMYNMTRSTTKQSRASLRSVSYRKGVIRIVIQHTLDTCPIPIFNDEHMDNLVVIDHSLGKPSAVREMKKSFPEGSMITWQACAEMSKQSCSTVSLHIPPGVWPRCLEPSGNQWLTD